MRIILNLKTMKKNLLSFLLVTSLVANAQFWNEKATGFATTNYSLNSISIVDASVIWASAYDNLDPLNPNNNIKKFTRSIDGGNTWNPGSITLVEDPGDNLDISSITAVSPTTAWISASPLTGSVNGGIWKTSDSGVTWNKQTTALFNNPTDSFANFVHFWDANNGIAGGDPEGAEFEIYTTTDGGANWIRVDGVNIPDPDPAGNEFGLSNIYFVSGNTIWFGTDSGRIFKSTDKGLTWSVTQSPSTNFFYDRFTFSDLNKGLLMTYSPTKLYSTTDGGSSWNLVTTTGYFYNTNIAYIPGTSKVVSGNSANPLGSSYSVDDGLNWITIDGVFHGTMVFLNDSFGFSASNNISNVSGGIFKFSGIPLSAPSFDNKKNILAYPNPTNGILKLNSDNSLIREASVFDLAGKQVYISRFPSLNTVDLDLKPLETGLYLLKVTSDSGKTETMKIMKN